MTIFDYYYYRFYHINKKDGLGHRGATFGAYTMVFKILFPQCLWMIEGYRYLMAVDDKPVPYIGGMVLVTLFIGMRYVNKENVYSERFRSSKFNKFSEKILVIFEWIAILWGLFMFAVLSKLIHAYFQEGALLIWFKSILE